MIVNGYNKFFFKYFLQISHIGEAIINHGCDARGRWQLQVGCFYICYKITHHCLVLTESRSPGIMIDTTDKSNGCVNTYGVKEMIN